MDWYKATLLVTCVVLAVSTPVVVVRALRRGDRSRLFDVAVSDAFLAYLVVMALWPDVIQNLPRLVRWSLLVLPLLFLANMFGLSQRLFKSGSAGKTPPA